jgi:hypothetical protein
MGSKQAVVLIITVTIYFPGITQASTRRTSDAYVKQWRTKVTLHKTFVTLATYEKNNITIDLE